MKKIIIISDVGKKVGLGHLIRSEVLTKEINFYFKKKIKVKNLLFSQEKKNNIFFKSNLVKTVFDINKKLKEYNPKIIFLNNSSLFEKKVSTTHQ